MASGRYVWSTQLYFLVLLSSLHVPKSSHHTMEAVTADYSQLYLEVALDCLQQADVAAERA